MLTKLFKKNKTILNDDFIKRLRSSVIGEGMLHEGNIYLINEAIKKMPDEGYVVEIGVYGGLSTNLILYLLRKNNRQHIMVGCDAWVYEGYTDYTGIIKSHIDGRKDIDRITFMAYIKNAYINAIKVLNVNYLPFTCHLSSNQFFNMWSNQVELTDVFDRKFKLKKEIAFCYIDGDHSYEQTKKDFNNVAQRMLKGGFILIDDSADYMNFGSAKFAQELKKDSSYKIVAKNPNYLIQKL